MKLEYLHSYSACDELILFFAGFGQNPSHFSHLDSKKNVLMVYDYSDFYVDFIKAKKIASYKKLWLVAFSMGVCVAGQILDSNMLNFERKIAINGSNYGINATFGIHEKIFKQTIKHFKLSDFKARLFGDLSIESKNFIFASENELQNELQSLYNFSAKQNLIESKEIKLGEFMWNNAIISQNDSIMPPQNMESFFSFLFAKSSQDSKIKKINAPHYPFFAFKSWEEICQIN